MSSDDDDRDGDDRASASPWRIQMAADMAYMRSIGLTRGAIQRAIYDYDDGEISASKLIDLVRAAARVMAEDALRERVMVFACEHCGDRLEVLVPESASTTGWLAGAFERWHRECGVV